MPFFLTAMLGLCWFVVSYPGLAIVALVMTSPTIDLAFAGDRWWRKWGESRNRIPKAQVHK